MSDRTSVLNRAKESVERGARWLLAMRQPDGSLRGGPVLDAYYKLPSALIWSGHRPEADLSLTFIAGRFGRPGGDLDGTGVAWFDRFRIYPHAWLACAGHVQLSRRD